MPLWSEQSSPENLDAIVWPRLGSAAEVFWTGATLPDGMPRLGRLPFVPVRPAINLFYIYSMAARREQHQRRQGARPTARAAIQAGGQRRRGHRAAAALVCAAARCMRPGITWRCGFERGYKIWDRYVYIPLAKTPRKDLSQRPLAKM